MSNAIRRLQDMSLTENLSGDNTNQGDYLKRAHDAETNGFKEDITDLANKAWNDTTYQGRASFKSSKKLNDKINEMLGHPIEEVFITASDVRHIKKHHSEHEDARGQVNISTGNLADIYDTLNDFDEATLEKTDALSNPKIMFSKHDNGTKFTLVVERGKRKGEVQTAYWKQKKKGASMFDVTSPEPNVRNDSTRPSFTSSIPQEGQKGQEEISEQELSRMRAEAKAREQMNDTRDDFSEDKIEFVKNG